MERNSHKWAIIGASTVARQHVLPVLRDIKGARATILYSRQKQVAAKLARDHELLLTHDFEAVLSSDVDCVYVGSMNAERYELCRRLLLEGKHVLAEKPMTLTVQESLELVRLAKKKRLVLAVNHHLRTAGVHNKIKSLINSNSLGEIQWIQIEHIVNLPTNLRTWRVNDPIGGGVALDILTHDIDLVHFLTGRTFESVSARGKRYKNGVLSELMTVGSLTGGALVHLHESFENRDLIPRVIVQGTKGTLVGEGVLSQQPAGTLKLWKRGRVRDIAFSTERLYRDNFIAFMRAVEGKGSPIVSGGEALDALSVTLSAIESLESGSSVRPKYFGLDRRKSH